MIAVEQFGAGPFGTRYLSDLGADVIKIEDPATGGDVSRSIPPRQVGSDSLYNESFNRGKRSVALDLKTDAGQASSSAWWRQPTPCSATSGATSPNGSA